MIESIKNYNCNNIEHDINFQSYIDDVIIDFQDKFNIDFSKKFLTTSKIKKFFNL